MGFLDLNGLDHYKRLTFDKLCDNIAPAFSASQAYAVDDYVMHDGVLYQCVSAVTAPGPWNAGNWVKYRIMTGPTYPVYGVEWDYSQSSPELTRTGDAAGLPAPVPATSLDGPGSSPFDSIMPWAGMKRYNIIDGAVAYSEDDAGFSETDYDTMVYIPEFYYKAVKDVDNMKWTWQVSAYPAEGFAKHPGSGRYIGRFKTSSSAGVYGSRAGLPPLANVSTVNCRSGSHAKGGSWYLQDLATWSAVRMLYLVEFASFNNQEKLGAVSVTAGQNTGGSSGARYHTGYVADSFSQYRWVENPSAQIYEVVDGIKVVYGTVRVNLNNDSMGNSNAYSSTGINLPNPGYVTGLGFSGECPFAFLPDAASGGSGSTYVTDYVNVATDNSDQVVYFGGVDSSSVYGLFYMNSGRENQGSNIVGSRLIFIPQSDAA